VHGSGVHVMLLDDEASYSKFLCVH